LVVIDLQRTVIEEGVEAQDNIELVMEDYTFRTVYGLNRNWGVSMSPEIGYRFSIRNEDGFGFNPIGFMANLPVALEWHMKDRFSLGLLIGAGLSCGYISNFSTQTLVAGPLGEVGYQFYLLKNLCTLAVQCSSPVFGKEALGIKADQEFKSLNGYLITANIYYHLGKGSEKSN
ncbi:MAG: hypothetical protein AAF193_08730, partial [Bacteroidota bacterium]